MFVMKMSAVGKKNISLHVVQIAFLSRKIHQRVESNVSGWLYSEDTNNPDIMSHPSTDSPNLFLRLGQVLMFSIFWMMMMWRSPTTNGVVSTWWLNQDTTFWANYRVNSHQNLDFLMLLHAATKGTWIIAFSFSFRKFPDGSSCYDFCWCRNH